MNGDSGHRNKRVYEENTVFADAFNYLIYNGKKVIDPAGLTEVDTATSAVGKKMHCKNTVMF